ncbi:MAG: tail fiber domain-containing protein [Sphingobacteriaceae bacterium]
MCKRSFIYQIFTVCLLAVTNLNYAQNLSIKDNSDGPNASAGLDVSFTNKGVLVPRVALTATNVEAPVTSPVNSLLVYNIATAGAGVTAVSPGFYYWSAGWNKLTSPGAAGTNQWITSGSNINNNTTGNVGIGSTAFAASPNTEKLLVDAGTATTTGLSLIGNRDGFFQFNLQNKHNGTVSSTDIVATANNGTVTTGYINMGINGGGYANYAGNILNGIHTAYLYGNGRTMKIGNAALDSPLIFVTNKTPVASTDQINGNEVMRIEANGNVGIGNFSSYEDSEMLENGPKLIVDGSVTAKYTGSSLGTSSLRWGQIYAVNSVIQTSDQRLKKNITELNYGLKEVMALKPVRYNWLNSDNRDNKIGLIAQDTKKIVPEVVYGNESEENLGINYSDLVPVIINAVKELKLEVDALKLIDDLQKSAVEFVIEKLCDNAE